MGSLREKKEFEPAFFKEKSIPLPVFLISILRNKSYADRVLFEEGFQSYEVQSRTCEDNRVFVKSIVKTLPNLMLRRITFFVK